MARFTCFLLGVLCVLGAQTRAESPADDELSKLYQSIGHYIVEDRKVTNELTETPTPMLDWGLVQPGFVAYVNQATRELLPLSDPHDVADANQIEAVPVASPAGVRIVAQPATKGGSFEQELFPPKFPWEQDCTVHTLRYDDADKLYKLWYRTKDDHFAYAQSKDFKTWDRPLLPHEKFEGHDKTNLLAIINDPSDLGDIRSADEARPRSSGAFFIDPSAAPEARYKCTFLAHVKPTTVEYAKESSMPLSAMTDPPSTVLFAAVSPDGVGWRLLPKPIMLHDADTLTVATYDTILKRYVMYTRLYELGRRSIGRSETTDFSRWPLPTNVLSAGPEQKPSIDYYAPAYAPYPGRPDIRTLLVLTYDRFVDRSEIRLASSRDGHAFHFTPGDPIIADANAGFLSAFPSLVRTPDGRMIAFYDSSAMPHKFPRHHIKGSTHHAAVWKADRLACVEAEQTGEFTTAAVTLRGNRIVLNMQSQRTGAIEVELRDEKFRPLPGHTFADADLLTGDHVNIEVTWKGNADVSKLKDQKLYLRLRLRAAKLFSIAAMN